MSANAEIILHHFDLSPFAEKIRLMLGLKKASWRSVKIPMIMPKPDLMALTGGYRKTPTLQIGADLWCDTALIARVIDERFGGDCIHPAHLPLAPALAQWADWTLFWSVVDFASQPACLEHRFGHLSAEQRAAIAADRNPFRATVPRLEPNDAQACLRNHLGLLQSQLKDRGPFLLGVCSVADFSVAHCLWHLRRAGPPAIALLQNFPQLLSWHDRMLALGHGQSQDMHSTEALEISASSRSHAPTELLAQPGLQPGQWVEVAATDYGLEPSRGTLVGLSSREVVIERSDPRAGTVHVHFPRQGFRVTAVS